MVDKMMRISGRNDSGVAKSIKTDDNGRLETKTNFSRKILDTKTPVIGPSVKATTKILSGLGFSHSRLILRFPGVRSVKVYVVDVIDGVNQLPRFASEISGNGMGIAEYTITSDSYFLELENSSSGVNMEINPSSYENLYNKPVVQKTDIETLKRNPIITQPVLAKGEKVRSVKLSSNGFSHGRLVLRFPGTRDMKVSIMDVVGGVEQKPRVINEVQATENTTVDYSINSDFYYIEVENTGNSTLQINSNSSETIDNLPFEKTENVVDNFKRKRALFAVDRTLEIGKQVISEKLNRLWFSYGQLIIRLSGERKVNVSIIDIIGGVNQPERVIFEGNSYNVITIDYTITADEYYVVVKNIGSESVQIKSTSVDVPTEKLVTRDVTIKNNPDEITVPIQNSIAELAKRIGSQRPDKYPSNSLIFKESPLSVQTITKGTDNFFYIVNEQGLINKYESIVDSSTAVETGITWNTAEYGKLQYLFVIDDGVVFFSDFNNGTNVITRIYRSNSINDTPVMVYEQTDTTFSTTWSRHFGMDHYYNGQSYFLASAYGAGQNNKDLVLSLDGGKTFTVVKKTVNIDTSGTFNSHWHDVSIDHYHGLLWASEGDGPTNRHVHYSEDLGKTWVTLSGDLQPTSIVPYPDKVVFGRDNNIVGLDTLLVPNSIKDLNSDLIYTQREFKTQNSAYYFAMQPVVYRNETYISFFLYSGGNSPMMIASGDFGQTWHGVHVGAGQNEIYNFVLADDKYIYAYKKSSGGLLYAKKPEWI